MSWPPPPPPPEPSGSQGWPPPPVTDAPAPAAGPAHGGGPIGASVPPASSAGWHTAPIPPRVSDGLITTLKVLLVLQVVAFALIAVARLVYAGQVADGAGSADLETAEVALGLLVLAWVGFVAIPATVTWCLWQSRTHRRLQALRPRAGFRHSSGWGVGAWFVPVANLFVPFRAVADLWRNSAPIGAAGPDPTPRQVAGWWVGFVGVPSALLVVAFLVGFVLAAGGAGMDDARILRIDAVVGLIQAASLGVAAWFAVQLVDGIHTRTRALESAADEGRL